MSTPTFALAPPASAGFTNASAYDTHRPSYLPSVVTSLLTHTNLLHRRGARIVEIGAGTGKFTELLVAREEGYEIVAVEPHAGMRGELERKLENGLGGIGGGGKEGEKKGSLKVVEGNAGEVPVEEGWADGCLIAQWSLLTLSSNHNALSIRFATEETLREIHRILRPGAVLGLLWNIEDYNAPLSWPPTTPYEAALNSIIWAHNDGHPRFRHLEFKSVFDDQAPTGPLDAMTQTLTQRLPMFSLPLGEETVPWSVWLGEEEVWERILTLSQIANLGEAEREGVRKEVLQVVRGVSEGERDKLGRVQVHARTYLCWTSRV